MRTLLFVNPAFCRFLLRLQKWGHVCPIRQTGEQIAGAGTVLLTNRKEPRFGLPFLRLLQGRASLFPLHRWSRGRPFDFAQGRLSPVIPIVQRKRAE
jgi:hypothetical protein